MLRDASLPARYLEVGGKVTRGRKRVEALENDLFLTKITFSGVFEGLTLSSALPSTPCLPHTLLPLSAFILSFQESLEEMQIGVSCK